MIETALYGVGVIISWHYNYDTRSMTFIDSEYKIWSLKVAENFIISEDHSLRETLGQ